MTRLLRERCSVSGPGSGPFDTSPPTEKLIDLRTVGREISQRSDMEHTLVVFGLQPPQIGEVTAINACLDFVLPRIYLSS